MSTLPSLHALNFDSATYISNLEFHNPPLNDNIRSLHIETGWSIRIYQHADRKGSTTCITSNQDDLWISSTYSDGTPILNNGISSFEIFDNSDCMPTNIDDTTPPSGTWISPSSNAVVGNTVLLSGDANDDNSGVSYVQFTAWWEGGPSPDVWYIVTRQTSPSSGETYSYEWNLCNPITLADGRTVTIPNGNITLGMDITDNAGNTAYSSDGTRTINKQADCGSTRDNTPPSGSWISPSNNQTIYSNIVNLSINASDSGGSGVREVRFSARWNNQWSGIGVVTTGSPYSLNWNWCSVNVPNGDVELGVEVWDNANNKWIYSDHYANIHITKNYDCTQDPEPVPPAEHGVYLWDQVGQWGNGLIIWGDIPSLGTYGWNDRARSTNTVGDFHYVVYWDDNYSGAHITGNGTNDLGDTWREQISSIRVRRSVNPAFTLYSLGDFNGEAWASDRTIYDMDHWDRNDWAESIRIYSGFEILACENSNFEGRCGRVTGPAEFSDINALSQGLRDGLSSIRVCAGSCPPPASPPNLIYPYNGQSINANNAVILDWYGGGTQFYVELWGGALGSTRTLGWTTATEWNVGTLTASGSPYYWRVKARNDFGESEWTQGAFSVEPPTVLAGGVFTTDEQGFSTALSAEIRPNLSYQSDLSANAIQANFNAGDAIRLYIQANNNTGMEQTAQFKWSVTDPLEKNVLELSWQGNLSTPDGTTNWYLPTTIPISALTGWYQFTGEINYNGNTTQQTVSFYVTGPHIVEAIDAYTTDGLRTLALSTVEPAVASLDTIQANALQTAFLPGDVIQLHFEVYNNRSTSVDAYFTWEVKDPNGLHVPGLSYEGTLSTGTGLTNWYLENTIGSTYVTGLYTFTASVTYNNQTRTATTTFHVLVANDEFDSAIIINSIPYTNSLNIAYATDANDDPIPTCAPIGKTVWYRFTPADDTWIRIDTNGSDFDTVLSVWTGIRGNLVQQACDDDSGISVYSQMDLSLTGGTTYYFLIGGYGGASGNLALNIVTDVTPPSSSVVAIPDPQAVTSFSVTWSGSDDLTSTELLQFDVQFEENGSGNWNNLIVQETTTSTVFNGTSGSTYCFRSRARDLAGNIEAWPTDPDTCTTVSGLPPSNQNLVRNGDFTGGYSNWSTWGDIDTALVNEVLQFKHRLGGTEGVAALYQDLNYNVPADAPFEIQLDLGNNSPVAKEVRVSLRHYQDWNESFTCSFTIPAHTPLTRYTVRGTTGVEWPNIRFEVQVDPADGIPDALMDNVSVIYNPDLSLQSTECGDAYPIPLYTYPSFSSGNLDLYVITGQNVALLVPSLDYSIATLNNMVSVFDNAYDYYAATTGREPIPYNTYNGLATIAVVPSTCGAGCAYLGFTGIEVVESYFDNVVYSGTLNNQEYDQLPFYELGRNFWFYGDQIEYKGADNTGSITTGFAVFMRFMAMDAVGVVPGPFNGTNFAVFRSEVVGLLQTYLADTNLNWNNTLRIGSAPANSLGLGASDLFASFMFDLQNRYGNAFIEAIWKEVGNRPAATSTQMAVDNFIIAASISAGENLKTLFVDEWRWPISASAIDELNRLFGWQATYYDTTQRWTDLNYSADFVCSETFSTTMLSVDYDNNAPCAAMDGENWVGDYTATLNFATGDYYFRTDHDDGFRLWIDGQLVTDNGLYGAECTTMPISLSGNHNLRVMLREDMGEANVSISWSTEPTFCPPDGSMTEPANGSYHNVNSILLTADAIDHSGTGIREVVFLGFGSGEPFNWNWVYLGSDYTAPYELNWNITSVADGGVGFYIFIYDNAGNFIGRSGPNVTIDRDAPTGTMTYPIRGSSETGPNITVQADIADATSGTQSVDFYYYADNTWVYIGSDNTAPFAIDWDVTSVPDGFYWVSFDAIDNAGNSTGVVTGDEYWTYFDLTGPANQAPTANDQNVSTNEDTARNITLTGSDPDGDSLSVTVLTNPGHGILSGTAPSLTYTPATNYHGQDGFTFEVCDPESLCDTGTISITVNPVNDAPQAVSDTATMNEDTSINIIVLANDTDLDGDTLTVTNVTTPAHGSASVNPDKTINYAPSANYFGSDSFVYTISDGVVSDTATVNIMVSSVNDAPAITIDVAELHIQAGQTASNSGGYQDVDGDNLTLSTSLGSVSGDGNGNWEWTHLTNDDTSSQLVVITATDPTGAATNVAFSLYVTHIPPIAPTNLAQTAALKTQISLSWTDNASNETHYMVERSAGGSSWSQIAQLDANSTMYADGGLTCETQYQYRVRAYRTNVNIYSGYSNILSAATSPCDVAEPTDLAIVSTTKTAVTLSWADNASNETTYLVERSTDGGSTWTEISQAPANSTGYTDNNLICESPYSYRVRAYRSVSDVYSAYSNVASGSTSTCDLLAPTNLQAAAGSIAITLSWLDQATNETDYFVERSADGGSNWVQLAQLPVDSTGYTDTGLLCQTPYSYRVRAYRSITSVYSEYATVNTGTGACPQLQPASLQADSTTQTSISLSWILDSTATSAVLYVNAGQGWTEISSFDTSVTTYTHTNLACGSLYQYRVQTLRQQDASMVFSPILETSTAGCDPLATPTLPEITEISRSYISLRVSSVPGASNLRLERATSGNWIQIAVISSGNGSYTDSALLCGTTYDYRVRAYRSRDGMYSAYSPVVSASTSTCPPVVSNTVGLYKDGNWIFRDTNNAGTADLTFQFGPLEAGWIALVGDWDGDGIDGIGLYKNGRFVLRNSTSSGPVDLQFSFGPGRAGWIPVAGDWNGDDIDTVGLYLDGTFLLTDDNKRTDYRFSFGPSQTGWYPVSGDWDGNGADSVGLFRNGEWLLTNSVINPRIDLRFTFGPLQPGWTPLAGNWDATGGDGIGLYSASIWRLRNATSPGSTDIGFNFGQAVAGWQPLASFRGGMSGAQALSEYANSLSLFTEPLPTDLPDTEATATVPATEPPAETTEMPAPPTESATEIPVPTENVVLTPTLAPVATDEPTPESTESNE